MAARAEQRFSDGPKDNQGEDMVAQPYLSLDLEKLPEAENLGDQRETAEASKTPQPTKEEGTAPEIIAEVEKYSTYERERIEYLERVSKLIKRNHEVDKPKAETEIVLVFPSMIGGCGGLLSFLVSMETHHNFLQALTSAAPPVIIGVAVGLYLYQAARHGAKFWSDEAREAKEVFGRIKRAKEVHGLDQDAVDSLVTEVSKDYQDRIVALEKALEERESDSPKYRSKIEARARELANQKGNEKAKK